MRALLFVATNFAILIVLGIVMELLGIDRMLARQGIPMMGVLVPCAVFGMGGSFISLLLSKWMAKRSTGCQVIDQPRNADEEWLLQTVQHQAERKGIAMPEVAIFPSPSPNAFATGANKNKALVAVSAGLLQRMDRDEVEAVVGHEISHVANGDMVTLTLIQGVLNTFVYFLARVIGQVLVRDDNGRGGGLGYFAVVIVAQMVLGILASTIVMAFSRWREFRADAGGAELAGRPKMIAALQALKRDTEPVPLPDQMQAFGISGRPKWSMKLFMSHPPLDERIARLQQRAG
jgi:heat shock protein HtpX